MLVVVINCQQRVENSYEAHVASSSNEFKIGNRQQQPVLMVVVVVKLHGRCLITSRRDNIEGLEPNNIYSIVRQWLKIRLQLSKLVK